MTHSRTWVLNRINRHRSFDIYILGTQKKEIHCICIMILRKLYFLYFTIISFITGQKQNGENYI